jgi:hypothetical protein
MTLNEVRQHITSGTDVARVIQVQYLKGDLYRYCIETTHRTFPKFVIGVFNPETKEVHLEASAGLYDTIRDRWQILNHGTYTKPV